jgi:hypothetical protein
MELPSSTKKMIENTSHLLQGLVFRQNTPDIHQSDMLDLDSQSGK